MSEKRKLIIITATLSSIISIIIFSTGIYTIYSRIIYRDCLGRQAGLILLDEDNIELISEELSDGKILQTYESYGINITREKGTGNITIRDLNLGYVKYYQNYVLSQMRVENPLADLISYFNPKVWYGGVRTISSDKVYDIIPTGGSEYIKVQQLLRDGKLGELSSKYTITPVGNLYFIER